MRGCPYPCEGYRPRPNDERPEQEVPVLGREWWRGRGCPGALVAEDPLVRAILRDTETVDAFAKGNSLEWFNLQPAWWCEGMREVKRMRSTIEAESLND